MKLELLANHPEMLPILAKWYFDHWGHHRENHSIAKEIDRLQEYLNINNIPLIVIALEEGELMGAAQLKIREMSIYPEKEFWLGGVYVSKDHRGKRVAEKIIKKIISLAEDFGVTVLYLQTEKLDGGLYRRMGWKPIEQVKYRGLDVLVMELPI
jgi:GNAT superfamily N-acetyltransferase